MGRQTVRPEDPSVARRLYLQRVRLDSGGYDCGGAYWGHGTEPLYRYCSEDGEADGFIRAKDRAAAKAKVLALVPGARFFR
jgi:hypothetical protein